MPAQIQLPSKSHLVVIPSYNSGPNLREVVLEALAYWTPVWVVVDGSTDGSDRELKQLAKGNPNLRVFSLPENRGKGSAVLHALDLAAKQSFTHVLCMDSDGQHPASKIRDYMVLSLDNPDCMILGKPVFDDSAPFERIHARKLSNFWTHLSTLFAGVGDSLFGFKLYPLQPLRKVMHSNRWGRRFDFDPEANIRLVWEGIRPINLPCHVRYLKKEEGGVSHFRYLRDTLLLTWMHVRLFFTFLFTKLPFAARWRQWKGPAH
jgi:glycosyltransferase involved in cell wall biosynthesis